MKQNHFKKVSTLDFRSSVQASRQGTRPMPFMVLLLSLRDAEKGR